METNKTQTLYRAAAAESPYFGAESCWTADRSVAEEYRDNGGYGGPVVYVATVEIDEARVLDLTGVPSAKIARRLATVLGFRGDERDAAEDRWSQAAKTFAPWETAPALRDMLAERYDWIVYDDDYPEGAVTWCYLGSDDIKAA